jgi:hypothetical protein
MCLLFRYTQLCKSLLAFLQFAIAAKTKFLAAKNPIIYMIYQDTSIMFLDIIHRLAHFLKNHNVLETGFCLRNVVVF